MKISYEVMVKIEFFLLQRFSALTASSTYVLKMLPNPGTPANVIAFHPYNPKIVVAGNNHIQMWDIEKGKYRSKL